jgi:hypothetical protein
MSSVPLCAFTLAVLLQACNSTSTTEQPVLPKPMRLQGRWHYDSTGLECYNASMKYVGGSTQPMRTGAILTIGAKSWDYSGNLHEVHAYTRSGRYLVTQRIGTARMVRSGYIAANAIGQASGRSREHEILLLTSQRLILRDTMRDTANIVDGHCKPDACFCVRRYYYSR